MKKEDVLVASRQLEELRQLEVNRSEEGDKLDEVFDIIMEMVDYLMNNLLDSNGELKKIKFWQLRPKLKLAAFAISIMKRIVKVFIR